MKIKKTYKIKKLDELELPKRMRTDKRYYHCIGCGGVYEDKNMGIEILSLVKLNRSITPLPAELSYYLISSGLCRKCFDSRRER